MMKQYKIVLIDLLLALIASAGVMAYVQASTPWIA